MLLIRDPPKTRPHINALWVDADFHEDFVVFFSAVCRVRRQGADPRVGWRRTVGFRPLTPTTHLFI